MKNQRQKKKRKSGEWDRKKKFLEYDENRNFKTKNFSFKILHFRSQQDTKMHADDSAEKPTCQELFESMKDTPNFPLAVQITESKMLKAIFGDKTTLNRFKVGQNYIYKSKSLPITYHNIGRGTKAPNGSTCL